MGTVLHKRTQHPGNVRDWTNIWGTNDSVMDYVVWDGTGKWSITKYGKNSANALKGLGNSDKNDLGVEEGHTGYWDNPDVLKRIRAELDNTE
ncbi:MAG: hypothetical protein U1C12_01710 [Patescibacteria group bacterium]|nr:hypothetical protein [Patescibacteria group bacterium]